MTKPWLNEPDFKKWIDPTTGLQCAISRNPFTGSLCGYVRVPYGRLRKRLYAFRRNDAGFYILEKHVSRKSRYDHSAIKNIAVHGGLTFCDALHRPKGGSLGGLWIGFDCAHVWDYSPVLSERMASIQYDLAKGDNGGLRLIESDQVYRDFPYVTNEVEAMAKQLKKATK